MAMVVVKSIHIQTNGQLYGSIDCNVYQVTVKYLNRYEVTVRTPQIQTHAHRKRAR